MLRAIADGDRSAFRAFYGRWGGRLLAILRQLSRGDARAEDVLQEVLVAVWRRAASYDPVRGDVGGWLYVICRNRWFDHARRQAREVALETGDASQPEDSIDECPELGLDLEQALRRLPPEKRRAVHLAFFGGLTHEEAASRLGVPLGTLKSRIRLGLLDLAKALQDDYS
ncbi:MAG: sigma-70 family RNA polymerase sigma factor [Acidobacteriota bacterium]